MTSLRLGIIPLSDCAVLAVAKERGFFQRHGIDATLSREVSWANIRDKVAAGALDGAQMLAGMPLAATLGIDPVARPMVTAFSLDLNGNAVTVSSALWDRMLEADPDAMAERPISARALRRVIDQDRRRSGPRLGFAVVFPFATHNYELRYWLAAAGIDPESEVRLSVVPPPRMVECLERHTIDGFCVGEPWNSLAVQRGLGRIVTTKYEIWNNSPEKVFAVNRDWAERHPEVHRAVLRALLEAAAWTDAAENRDAVAGILSDPRYVGAPRALLRASLTDRLAFAPDEPPVEVPDFHVFHRYAASFPWTSHAAWLLLQMLRWGQVSEPIDVLAVARAVYRPDLYRAAARELGFASPEIDVKSEGVHAAPWTLLAADAPIAMGPDLFLDGRQFHPTELVKYLARSGVNALRVDLDALAARNP